MCLLSPSPRKRGFFLDEAVLLLDSDYVIASGLAGAEALAVGHLSRGIRTEIPKVFTRAASFRRSTMCKSAQTVLLQKIAEAASRPVGHPVRHLSSTDWSLVIMAACLAGRLGKKRRPMSPILVTGENKIVSVADTEYGLHAQVTVSPKIPTRFWYFIGEGRGARAFQEALAAATMPLPIP